MINGNVEQFLESPVFDRKTFWEVESELAWLDDGGSVKRSEFSPNGFQ